MSPELLQIIFELKEQQINIQELFWMFNPRPVYPRTSIVMIYKIQKKSRYLGQYGIFNNPIPVQH
jgi:hypothetical protein